MFVNKDIKPLGMKVLFLSELLLQTKMLNTPKITLFISV